MYLSQPDAILNYLLSFEKHDLENVEELLGGRICQDGSLEHIGKSIIKCIDNAVGAGGFILSDDISYTVDALCSLGAGIDVSGDEITVTSPVKYAGEAVIDCGESGSTLRFLIPVCSALGGSYRFIRRKRLPQRPISALIGALVLVRKKLDRNITTRQLVFSGVAIALDGFSLYSDRGEELFLFPDGAAIAAGAELTVGTRSTDGAYDLLWDDKKVINKKKVDAIDLFDAFGRLVDENYG